MIEITLPYPPSVNNYKTVGKLVTKPSGKIYQQRINSAKTKRFYFEVWMKIRQLMAKEGLKSFGGATICLEVDVYPPDARKRDLSNILKTLEDSLQRAGLFDDDYQIARLLVTRCQIIPHGQIICRITPI
jgi:crossover junction endodeoxyribonuclease RusA